MAETQPYEVSNDLTKAKPNFESSLAVVGFTVLVALVALPRCNDPGRGRLYPVVRSIVNEMTSDRYCLSNYRIACTDLQVSVARFFVRMLENKALCNRGPLKKPYVSPPFVDSVHWVLLELTCSTCNMSLQNCGQKICSLCNILADLVKNPQVGGAWRRKSG